MLVASIFDWLSLILFLSGIGMIAYRFFLEYNNRHSNDPVPPNRLILFAVVAIVSSVGLELASSGVFYVQPTNAAARINTINGNVDSIPNGGLQLTAPFIYEYVEIDARVQEGDFNKSDVDGNSDLRCIEVRDSAMNWVCLDITLLWSIDRDKVADIYLRYENLQTQSNFIYQQARESARIGWEGTGLSAYDFAAGVLGVDPETGEPLNEDQLANTTTALSTMKNAIQEEMEGPLVAMGVDPDSIEVVVRNPNLDPQFVERIQATTVEAQNLQLAKVTGEREAQQAENIANVNRINAESKLEVAEIDNRKNVAESQAKGEAELVLAELQAQAQLAIDNGAAEGVIALVNAYGGSDTYAQILAFQAINPNLQIMMVPADGMQIMDFTGLTNSFMPLDLDGSQSESALPVPQPLASVSGTG